MPSPVQPGGVLTIRIDPDFMARVKAQAAFERRTLTALVTHALETYLDSIEEAPRKLRRGIRQSA